MGTTQATEVADLIVDIYREALGNDGLDENSDFFDAGGDSLAAFQVTGRLEAELEVEVPVALVFAYPTPAELATVVDAGAGHG
jgi:acyl carrier protein